MATRGAALQPTEIGAAQYLLRFDDICPTMDWAIWARIEQALVGLNLAPILAVVPDNQDAKLAVNAPDPGFWDHVRRWQAMGWTIGLHGYQHVYETTDSGILRLHARSEFAGLAEARQAEKLDRALAVFDRERVHPDLWVAPAHSFDRVTVRLLLERGIRAISDGFSLYPFRARDGMLWIPQQLWKFRPRSRGVWTVCYHHSQWGEADEAMFDSDLAAYEKRVVSAASVMANYGRRRRSAVDVALSCVLHVRRRAMERRPAASQGQGTVRA